MGNEWKEIPECVGGWIHLRNADRDSASVIMFPDDQRRCCFCHFQEKLTLFNYTLDLNRWKVTKNDTPMWILRRFLIGKLLVLPCKL